MNLRDYARSLRNHWLLLTACTLACVLAALGVTLAQSPVYEASARLFVSVQTTGQDSSGLAQGGQFTQQRVKSYASIVNSPQVSAAVLKQLKLPGTAESLSKQVTASAPLDTVLIDVAVRDGSAARARNIANAVAAQFGLLVNELETPQGVKVSPVKVSVVRQASLPASPASPNRTLNLALGLLVGLALGAAGAVLRDTLDTSVKSPDELHERTGIVTLAAIANDPDAAKQPLIVQA
ncbi:MAG: Wzz/FepE/Etk N-terminal domain-containing protein, partial [Frankiaceae bacterium]